MLSINQRGINNCNKLFLPIKIGWVSPVNCEVSKINTVIIKTEYEEGKLVPKEYFKHQLVTSHTARRTFCTNAFLDGIPVLSIMSISGHRTEKAFLRYIKISGQQHAKNVLDIWTKDDKSTELKDLAYEDYSI